MAKVNEQGLIILKRTGIPTLRNQEALKRKLKEDRSIVFSEEIRPWSVTKAIEKIKKVNEEKNAHLSKEPITLYLDSVGGEIPYMVQLITAIRRSKIKVHIKADAMICSAAIPLLAAGDFRTATDLTSFMHHNMSHGIFFEGFTKEKHRQKINEMEFIEGKWLNFLSRRTKLSCQEWMDLIGGGSLDDSHWFGAEEALKYGLIDEIENIWDVEKI